MKLKVNITTEDGELLDQFLVDNEGSAEHADADVARMDFTRDVRACVENVYNTEDLE